MDTQMRPNIILINCDDLGYGDVGCYGSRHNRTPALDRMAAEGMRLTDFYMPAPVCSPSRGGMLTGCYPRRIGFGSFEGRWVLFPGQPVGLGEGEVTVADILRRQGYATKLVGKWHCGDQPPFLPTRHGFDSFYGLPYSNDMGYMTHYPHYPPLPLMRDEEVIQQQPDQASLTERYTEQAVRFLRDNRGGPFFLYLAHMYVHVPLYVPARFQGGWNGVYGGAVACIDWSTSVLLHELKRLGIDERTVVIFTSDNGGAIKAGGCNAPLRGQKGTTWEGGLRVPCIVRWPGTVPAGTTCAEVVTAMDFLPTLAALAGGQAPADRIIDGRDIGPLLRGQDGARSPHAAFYYYFRDDLEGVRSGRWKLHAKTGQLYDLAADVGESQDVSRDNADVVRRLSVLADAAREDLGDAATGAAGRNCRPCGRVEKPDTLTHADADHPYIVAAYD